jgi:GNAT superfamily N-acetyltransferase
MADLLASLVLAVAGAALTFVFQRVQREGRNRRLRRQYPVGGLFTTEFEDREGDRVFIEKGLTRIHQHGTDIRGVTSELQSGRCWDLEGSVSPGGFVHGIYTAEDPHDTGMGTFFLRINGSTGDMDGLWAGYDSVNQSITGGRYTFKRCPDADIRVAASQEYPEIVALLGDALGNRYIDVSQLQRMGQNQAEVCFVAYSENRLVGAAIARCVGQEELADVFPQGQAVVLEDLPLGHYHRRVGFVSAIAVAPDCRGRGLATQLTRTAMKWLREKGATAALSFGWKSSRGCHISGVLNSCGFEAHNEVPGFWTEDSANASYSCPECGKICKCTAVIFTRSLSDLPAGPSNGSKHDDVLERPRIRQRIDHALGQRRHG